MSLAWQNISMQDLSFKVHVQANLEQFYKENVFAYGHIIGGWGTYISGGGGSHYNYVMNMQTWMYP